MLPLVPCHDIIMILTPLPVLCSIADILRNVLCKFESNLTDGSGDIPIFTCPLFFWSDKHLQWYQCPLHRVQHLICLPHLSFVQPPSMCHSPHDWNVADWMHEFRLFKCQFDTWFQLCKIKAEECLDYLLCILGKDGYAAMDHWVPTDEAHKWDSEKFLDYLESTLDDEISPKSEYMSLKISRRGLTNQLMNL